MSSSSLPDSLALPQGATESVDMDAFFFNFNDELDDLDMQAQELFQPFPDRPEPSQELPQQMSDRPQQPQELLQQPQDLLQDPYDLPQQPQGLPQQPNDLLLYFDQSPDVEHSPFAEVYDPRLTSQGASNTQAEGYNPGSASQGSSFTQADSIQLGDMNDGMNSDGMATQTTFDSADPMMGSLQSIPYSGMHMGNTGPNPYPACGNGQSQAPYPSVEEYSPVWPQSSQRNASLPAGLGNSYGQTNHSFQAFGDNEPVQQQTSSQQESPRHENDYRYGHRTNDSLLAPGFSLTSQQRPDNFQPAFGHTEPSQLQTLGQRALPVQENSALAIQADTPSKAPAVPIARATPSTSMTVPQNGPVSGSFTVPPRVKPGRKPMTEDGETGDRRKEQNRKAQRKFRDKRVIRLEETQKKLEEEKQNTLKEVAAHARTKQNFQELEVQYRKQVQSLHAQENNIRRLEAELCHLKLTPRRPNQGPELGTKTQRDSAIGKGSMETDFTMTQGASSGTFDSSTEEIPCGFCENPSDTDGCSCRMARVAANAGNCGECRSNPTRAAACRGIAATAQVSVASSRDSQQLVCDRMDCCRFMDMASEQKLLEEVQRLGPDMSIQPIEDGRYEIDFNEREAATALASLQASKPRG